MLKYIYIFSFLITLVSCSANDNLANCIIPASVSITTDLNNPQLISALVPGGFANITGGYKNILLVNVNGTDYIAYDKICPANDCNSAMNFKNGLVLKCSCDGSEYGVGKGIGGRPLTDGFLCSAIEYRVIKNGSAIRITNF